MTVEPCTMSATLMSIIFTGPIDALHKVPAVTANNVRMREIEREIHYVHWASKTYEDESVLMSEAHLGWQ